VSKDIQKIIDSPVLVLIGPTAIGKTALALELADRFCCEIVSVDSMQVYRYMDIGTAKPSLEEQERVVHHLIDMVDPDAQFDAAQFVKHALTAIDVIVSKGKVPLLTGGTGMYLKALIHGMFESELATNLTIRQNLVEQLESDGKVKLFDQLQDVDPETASRIHQNDTQRLLRALEIYLVSGKPWSEHLQGQSIPPVKFKKILQIGLTCDRKILYERIEERSRLMMQAGLIEEVEGLREMGYSSELSSMQSIGYRHGNNYLAGVWDMDETMRLLMRDTRRYAKRQMTWFGNNPALQWFDRNKSTDVLGITDKWLND